MELSLTAREIPGRLGRCLSVCGAHLASLLRSTKKTRALTIEETAPLGERRFVAVARFEEQRFLIGGAPGSVTLLAHLRDAEKNENARR
jgi:flagellar biogenesis protein FliO